MKTSEIITQKIIEKLESGTIPWQKPWNLKTGRPRNLISKKPYRGINLFMLSLSEFAEPYYLTFNQVKELGGSVKAGAKGNLVVFYKSLEVEKDGEKETIPMLKYYHVFNVEQTTGVKYESIQGEKKQIDPIEEAEKIVSAYVGAPVIEPGTYAAYSPVRDVVTMPDRGLFVGSEEYYCTLFHEMIHSTGHESRLNRLTSANVARFGNAEYSKEELIAEMGAAMLCHESGILPRTLDNSAAYIQSWIRVLKGNSSLVISAAAGAQKACDYMTVAK